MSKLKTDFRYDNPSRKYGEVEKNTLNEDDTYEPEEERIFIDDDPYDVNEEALITLNQRNTMKIESEETFHSSTPVNLIQSDMKNLSKQKKAYDHLGTNHETLLEKGKNDSKVVFKGNHKLTTVAEINHETKANTKNWTRNFESVTDASISDYDKIKTESIDEKSKLRTTTSDFSSQDPFTEEVTAQEGISEKSHEFYEEELQIEKHFHDDNIYNDSLIVMKNETETNDELEKPKDKFEEEKELEVLRRSEFKEEKNGNFSKSIKDEKEEKNHKLDASNKNIYPQKVPINNENVPILSISGNDSQNQPTIGPVVVFSKGKTTREIALILKLFFII